MFENPRRGRQARNFTTNVPKIRDLKSSSEQIFSKNWRWVVIELFCGHWTNKKEKLSLKLAERESNNKVSSTVNRYVYAFSLPVNARLVRVFFCDKLLLDRVGFPFSCSADSLSRSVHCTPDENDRPSEQTITFKLSSVYVTVLFNYYHRWRITP